MAGSEPRRRSPRHLGAQGDNAAMASNAPAPSPLAGTPSKHATPTRAEAKEKENTAATPSSVRVTSAKSTRDADGRTRARDASAPGRAASPPPHAVPSPPFAPTPDASFVPFPLPPSRRRQILKRRRRSILADVSKMEGASPVSTAAARKKRKQSLANRRVSFAVDTALESVREFQKDENAAMNAFPDPSSNAASSARATGAAGVPPKPPAVATVAACPPPGPAPSPRAAAEKPPEEASNPAAEEVSNHGAEEVSNHGAEEVSNRGASASLAISEASPASAPPASATKRLDPFAAFGVSASPGDVSALTPAGGRASVASLADAGSLPGSAAPSSAGGSAGGASASGADPSPGAMFTAHLPRRVTMDPTQYRDAMRAAGMDEGPEPVEEADEEEEEEKPNSGEDDFAFDAVTAAVPGLSALADEDDADARDAPTAEDEFGFGDGPGDRTLEMLAGMKAKANDITAAVPGLSALADEDDAENPGAEDFYGAATEAVPYARSLAETSLDASAEQSPAIEGLPMGSVTEEIAADLAAELAAKVARDYAATRRRNDDEEHRAEDDEEEHRADASAAPTPTATVAFADSPAVSEAALPTPASEPRGGDIKKRRVTFGGNLGVLPGAEALGGWASSSREKDTPEGAPAEERRAAEATNTLNVDARGAEVMGKETYDFVYGGGGGGPGSAGGADASGSGSPLDLSDSFEVPAGAEAAATSVTRDGLTTVGSVPSVGGGATGTGTETTTPGTATTPANTGTLSSDAFDAPGQDTMRMLLKMKDNRHGDAPSEPASDPAATAGGDTTREEEGKSEEDDTENPGGVAAGGGFASAAHTHTGGLTLSSWGGSESASAAAAEKAASASAPSPFHTGPTPRLAAPGGRAASTPSTGPSDPSPAPSSHGTVTPANDVSAVSSEGDGFTPGPDTLLMMQKLKGRQHGDAAENLESVRRSIMPLGGRPSTFGGFGNPSPLPPIGGAFAAAFTPNRNTTIAGGASAWGGFHHAEATTRAFGAGLPFGASHAQTSAGPGLFTPGAAQRLALHEAKHAHEAKVLGTQVLALSDLPPLPPAARDKRVNLGSFFRACEVSFMDAKNLRRKSLALESLASAPAPETLPEAFKLVCLTAPLVEATDPLHDELGASFASLASEVEALRAETERAQPPALRLAASDVPAHVDALRRSGKALKKQCQLVAKDDFAIRRLATEKAASSSLHRASEALRRASDALARTREVLAETQNAADVREVDLKRRMALSADVASRTAARMKTKRGALSLLAERRAKVADLRAALVAENRRVETAQAREGAVGAELTRLRAEVEEARASARANGRPDRVDLDGGANARREAAERRRLRATRAKTVGDALAATNLAAPWTLLGVSGAGGGELSLGVGRLFRVVVNVGTGAGRVTLASESANVTPSGGAAFVAAVAGVPRAWNETSVEARRGDCAAVLQCVAPALRRAEAALEEIEKCRDAFPRITRARCTAGGDLELTFCDLAMERIVTVALTFANGAYPRGGLSPRVAVRSVGAGPELPTAAGIEAAIDRVPAGESGRRLFGVCRLVDWIVARGERGMAEAAAKAAVAAKPAPPRPAPPEPLRGVGGLAFPRVRAEAEGEAEGDDAEPSGFDEEVYPERETGALRSDEGGESGEGAEEGAEENDAVPPAAAEREGGGSIFEAEETETFPAAKEKTPAGSGAAAPSPAAKTPAGFNVKGSNPLFDESMDHAEEDE